MQLLLCEDERDLSSAIKRFLDANKYQVDQAYDGVSALEKILYFDYDLIILDVMMPRMDGFEVLEKMRKAGKSTPVLVLTARGEIDDKVLGLDLGADDYMTKPFQVKELLARIRALLRRKSDFIDSYSIGNLVLDPKTFEMKADTSVHLTSTEYKLMEYLIRNKDRVVSTELIMERVWDYETEAEINVVWAYISALRKKLKAIGAEVTILAKRSLGYQLGVKE